MAEEIVYGIVILLVSGVFALIAMKLIQSLREVTLMLDTKAAREYRQMEEDFRETDKQEEPQVDKDQVSLSDVPVEDLRKAKIQFGEKA